MSEPTLERAARFVEHAYRYADLGWALTRLKGKDAFERGWQKTEPKEPDLVAGMWSEWGKRYNVGVVLGTSGLVVVEDDSETNGQRLRELLGDEIQTPTVRARRGLHRYFRDPGGISKFERDGLELRGGAHQCVLPPSVHPVTKRPYVWLPGRAPWEVETVELTAEALAYFEAVQPNSASPAPAVDAVIPDGKRHDVLLSLAGTLRRKGMDGEEILASLAAVNERRCTTPLPADELKELATDVGKRYPSAETIGEPAYTGPARPLDEVLTTFRRWLHLPDPGALYVALAVVVANRLAGDPIWLLFVGASSSGKSEILVALGGLEEVVPAATLTEASLLSGTPRKDAAAGASGGLLKKIGAYGILTLKDFGSVLSMHRDARAATLAALRECYDGAWDRPLGADGGKVLSWRGKLGLIAGVTTVVDRHHGVIDSLGSRFAFYRIDVGERKRQAARSLRHRRKSRGMRDELRDAVAGLFAGLELPESGDLSEADETRLVELADFVTVARSPIERDSYAAREIELIPDAEAPARFVLVLASLLEGLRLIGIGERDAWTLVTKVALDSMPALRRKVIEHLRTVATSTTPEVATVLGLPTTTARRTLEDLAAHDLVKRVKEGDGKADVWNLAPWAVTALAVATGGEA